MKEGTPYTRPVDESLGDLMTVAEFKKGCKINCFTDYDGHGTAVQLGFEDPDSVIIPSNLNTIPEDATHILWFNR